MNRFAASLIIFLAAPLAVRGDAQNATDPSAARVAVERVVGLLQTSERLPRGDIGFDGRVLESQPAPQSGPGASTYVLGGATQDARIYHLLGARQADFERAVVCASESPRSCRLPDVLAVFATGQPERTESGVRVVVAARWRSTLEKTPVPYGRFAVTLDRAASGEWIARDVRTLFIS